MFQQVLQVIALLIGSGVGIIAALWLLMAMA